MNTLFISDLHLDTKSLSMTTLFLAFLQREALHADALYILGDLFEMWLGDDDNSDFNCRISQALLQLSKTIPVYFMPGNRDFLLGATFARASGLHLLSDPTVISLYGTPTLLMHGDTLCTDDIAYLQARKKARDPVFQQSILNKPLWLRRWIGRYYRAKSRYYTRHTAPMLMDANRQAIEDAMQQHQVSLLIHGHTHRPAIHYFQLHGLWVERIVLSDWHDKGNVLICNAEGQRRLQNWQ